MDHHLRILQQRIQSIAIWRKIPDRHRKGIRGEIHQQEEEDLHRRNDHRRVSDQTDVHFIAQSQDQAVGREQQRPEQQRAFLS